jgi:hypothetical protein
MKLWECNYKLYSKCCDSYTYESDSWWSSTPPTVSTQQNFWDVIFPGNYTVSEFTYKAA